MTNRFKFLDTLFPCGRENRLFGEVVSIQLTLSRSYIFSTKTYCVKRKAWYVNASVNAWHLHRALCREVKTSGMVANLNISDVNRRLGDIVSWCYVNNFVNDVQYSEWELCIIDWYQPTLDKLCALRLAYDGVAVPDDEQVMEKSRLQFAETAAKAGLLARFK